MPSVDQSTLTLVALLPGKLETCCELMSEGVERLLTMRENVSVVVVSLVTRIFKVVFALVKPTDGEMPASARSCGVGTRLITLMRTLSAVLVSRGRMSALATRV